MKTLTRLILLSILTFVSAGLAVAQMPGQHPTYMHALADLEEARARLDKPAANEKREAEEANAIKKIDNAIDLIKRAATEDGKNLAKRQSVDSPLEGSGGRYAKVQQLLESALRNASAREDNPRARGLQTDIIANINEAHHIVERLVTTHRR
jgi:hypothetical protein